MALRSRFVVFMSDALLFRGLTYEFLMVFIVYVVFC